ncbi:uncharacterized protein F5147DRAFT_728786 [Suillus discolor]|uniref:Uncharacterized protein n=1 Tax=Suillus discolor TaxID=1912936 RepID=A0A9P7ERD1_9AGAM|nr:uncharacterized protein F5147DRAFT_728786 [Suillus discolor]KAG2086595.1 hypothetical protein F5147DRAFT_728786 [Suillus discolor]
MSQVLGLLGPFIARRPCPQRVPSVCVSFGSCTVSIFSCPTTATLAGWALSLLVCSPNPNPNVVESGKLSMNLIVTKIANPF